MSSATNSSVLHLDRSRNETSISSEMETNGHEELIQKEISEALNTYLHEYESIQQSHTERMEKIESSISEETAKARELFKNIGEELDQFKSQIREYIETQLKNESEHSQSIQQEITAQLEQLKERISAKSTESSDDAVQALREELIEGIRMLGKRVTKAIKDMDDKFKDFSTQIQNMTDAQKIEPEMTESQSEFGNIKESELINYDEYEVVPKKSIEKMADLFRKHSQNMKTILKNQQAKVNEFEQLLKTYDEENAKLLEILSTKSKRNFLLSIIATSTLAILILIMKFLV